MKKSKKCPKCGGREIFTDEGVSKRGQRTGIGISTWQAFKIDAYICMNCGYLEEYVCESDLKDEKKRKKIAENWQQL